ncbi:cytochrome b-c1 complex subunit 6, mitochondrial [Daphnia magna]|uniref:cytochrome b-c1 complex subunit 6, mitochondrial n=1 Tax=Daphnia magna TaxID=35525 RepID=UPI001E1BAFC0|nr:cytochrome b-c1 complex subunit 6, mitochondrial [Daphnia magna]
MSDQEAPELVDPAVAIKEKCTQTKECAALLEKFNACNDRVASKSATTETCVEEQADFLHCVDHCLAPQLFKHLK